MDTLKDTLALVNDWLKFAEAKNAVIVAAAGVALWALVRLIVLNETNCYFRIYSIVFALFFLGGFIVSLLSFLPVLNYRWIVPASNSVANKNLLYFGYLSTLSKNQLLNAYRHATQSKEANVIDIHGMYAEQIIINSRIALVKYAMFEYAIKILLCGVLTPLIAVPLLYFLKRHREKTYDIG
jgi:hypothetical protein